jgi:hypothetical protein
MKSSSQQNSPKSNGIAVRMKSSMGRVGVVLNDMDM